MQINVRVELVSPGLDEIKSLVTGLSNMLVIFKEQIMATQDQLAADLGAVTTQIQKIGTETSATLQKVADLEAALAAGNVTTPAVDAAMAALKAQAQLTDDLIPDAPPVV